MNMSSLVLYSTMLFSFRSVFMRLYRFICYLQFCFVQLLTCDLCILLTIGSVSRRNLFNNKTLYAYLVCVPFLPSCSSSYNAIFNTINILGRTRDFQRRRRTRTTRRTTRSEDQDQGQYQEELEELEGEPERELEEQNKKLPEPCTHVHVCCYVVRT